MSSRFEKWLYGLGSAAIGGFATPIAAQTGLALAQSVGVHAPLLDWKQMGSVAIASAVATTAAYLKQSPLPPESSGDTDLTVKPQDKI